MINKEIFLALFIDKYNVVNHYYILKKFPTTLDLDLFTSKFKDSEELRKYFEIDISEYFMDNKKIINQNETKNKKFQGRISAFYYNSKSQIEFIEISYHNKKIVRDYKELHDVNESFNFIKKVYDISFDKLNKMKLTLNNKVYYLENILEKYNYHISDEEKKYLKDYLKTKTNYSYQNLMIIIKTNIKRQFLQKEAKIMQEKEENNLEKVSIDEDADEFLKYNINDDEKLYLYHDIDEIDRYTDKFMRRK